MTKYNTLRGLTIQSALLSQDELTTIDQQIEAKVLRELKRYRYDEIFKPKDRKAIADSWAKQMWREAIAEFKDIVEA